MITYGSHGQHLYGNGYHVIPLSSETKIPVTEGWVSAPVPPDYEQYSNCSIGIRCGTRQQPVYAVDLDIKNQVFIQNLIKEIGFKNEVYRIGNPPKRLYLFRGLSGGVRKRTSTKYVEGHIEILGYGQQFAAFGIHPKTKRPYQWPCNSPVSVAQEKLPVISVIEIDKLLKLFDELADVYGFTVKEKKKESENNEYDANNPLFEKAPFGLSDVELRKMVSVLDPDCGRDMWRDIGFALHHETEGSETGYNIWDEWSSKGIKYKEGETEYQWDSFGKNNQEPITAAYLKKLYNEKTLEDVDDIVKNEAGIDPGDPFANINWSVNRFAKEPPKLEMVIENVMPKGITGLLFSAGGAGKSTLMLYLASRVAFASYFPCEFAGCAINGGRTVILTAEDPDIILNRRYIATAIELSREFNIEVDKIYNILEDNLKIISTFGKSINLFGLKNDMIKPTKGFLSFLKRLKSLENIQLIIIDTKTRYSPGEGLGNVTASDEIKYYEMLALATGATIILLHHTNKKSRDGSQDGSQAYRDATAWFDNTRFSWFFRPVTEKEAVCNGVTEKDITDYFILENAKNNYVRRQSDRLVHRSGYQFNFKEAVGSGNKEDAKDNRKQDLIDNIVAWMQSIKDVDLRQAEIIKWCKDELNSGRSRVLAAIDAACDDGIMELTDGGVGKTKRYGLTGYGLLYNLQVE